MQASIRLGRVAGIPIGPHYSWLIIATLITLSLSSHFRGTNPEWTAALVWLSAIVTAVLFFASLVAHELSHAIVAKSRGLPVRSITLFALGGVAQIERDAGSAKTEFWMAIAGPIASLVIGFACIAAALAMGWSVEGRAPGPAAAILGWLGSINVVLAGFNVLPGYPLDGGRVLRCQPARAQLRPALPAHFVERRDLSTRRALVRRVHSEFLEMPGLILSIDRQRVSSASRLASARASWASLSRATCCAGRPTLVTRSPSGVLEEAVTYAKRNHASTKNSQSRHRERCRDFAVIADSRRDRTPRLRDISRPWR